MKENRRKDAETAKASMKRGGCPLWLVEEQEATGSQGTAGAGKLEAKYLGLVFVAEVKRKEKEKADKLQKMQERAKAIEAQDARIGSRRNSTAEAIERHGCLCRVGETAS